MQTASGQTVKDSSNHNTGQTRGRRARRRGLSPTAIAIALFLFVISVLVMGASLLGYWPPKSADASKTIAEQWQEDRTATPSTQYLTGVKVTTTPVTKNLNGVKVTTTPGIEFLTGLKVEKVGKPSHEVVGTEKLGNTSYQVSTVTVTLKVMNNVMVPDLLGKLVEANLNSGTVKVLFYNVENGKQVLVGGGVGTVVNLKYGESQTIDIVSTSVRDYSDATQYEAFPDSIWTDKDAVKATPSK